MPPVRVGTVLGASRWISLHRSAPQGMIAVGLVSLAVLVAALAALALLQR
jgi:hypothetical protein